MKIKLVTALLAIFTFATAPITPANAYNLTWNNSLVTITVGESVDLTIDCGEPEITGASFSQGTLPPGLEMSPIGVVSGIPTTSGDFVLSSFTCSLQNGYKIENPLAKITFRVNADVTPDPILVAHNLNTDNCSFYTGFAFPEVPDSGTVSLKFENQAGTVLTFSAPESTDYIADEMQEEMLSISGLNSSYYEPNISITGTVPFSCGDTLSITVGYKWRGAPLATKTISNIIVDRAVSGDNLGSEPALVAIALNNTNCDFRIIGSLPSTPTANSTKVSLNVPGDSTNSAEINIVDTKAGELIDLTLNPLDMFPSISLNEDIVSNYNGDWEGGVECNNLFEIKLEYLDFLGDRWETTTSITPTQPAEGLYSISAAKAEIGTCSISVIANVPDEVRPLEFTIMPVGLGYEIAAMSFDEGTTIGGNISATLSLASVYDMQASIDFSSIQIYRQVDCAGTYKIVMSTFGEVITSSFFTIKGNPVVCNSGSIIDLGKTKCTEVNRGFYTTQLNSITPISCPKGMTTATTASKSINDCYKPLVQSIVGFKSPKALKFKGTTNLSLVTNTKALATFKVAGPCTAKITNIITKVKGKKVTTKMLKVTAGKKAGICLVTLSSKSKDKYLALSTTTKIKVSKTGK